MSCRHLGADSLRRYMTQVFLHLGCVEPDAADAADVLLWASLRSVDTHGIRNLKPYYVDRIIDGILKPGAQPRVEFETPLTARMDGDSGIGLVCARQAMAIAIEKAHASGVGIVTVRNTHHLGPAGYFSHMAVEHGMLGMCATGHFFGKGHPIGVAPPGTFLPLFSTNPLSFAAPCGQHASFVLDMATAVATVNRIEMHGQAGQPIPLGWARDIQGIPTTDPNLARVLTPLGGTTDLGCFKGAGLGMMVTVLSGVLSGAWAAVSNPRSQPSSAGATASDYDQPTMGHILAAIRVDAFQPLEQFRRAMDAMIDALHAAPRADADCRVCYPGEIEAATAAERAKNGIPIDDRLFAELQTIADRFGLAMPNTANVS